MRRLLLLCLLAALFPCAVWSAFPFLVNITGTVNSYPAYARDTVTQMQQGGYDGAGGSLNLFQYGGSFYNQAQQFLGTSGDAFYSTNGGLSWISVNSTITNSTTAFISLPGLPSHYIDIPGGVWLINGTMLLIAGLDNNDNSGNEVYYSTNGGVNWALGTTAAPWSPRIRPVTGVVRGLATPGGTYADESYFVAAGLQLSGVTNDVWLSRSPTGAVWQRQTATPGFPNNLIEMASAVLPYVPYSIMDAAKAQGFYYAGNSTIVIAGGTSGGYGGTVVNDVWRSTNLGVTWTHFVAPWTPRAGSSLVAFGSVMTVVTGSLMTANNSLLLLGGINSAGTVNDEGWLTFDQGATWQQIQSSTLPTLAYFECFVSNYQIVTYGGFNSATGIEYLAGGLILSLPQTFLSNQVVTTSSSSSSTAPVATSAPSVSSSRTTVSSSSSPIISSSTAAAVSSSVVSSSAMSSSAFSSSTPTSAPVVPVMSSTGVSRISGDPHFIGLRGQPFQVHGLHGTVYSLIVDDSFSLNARFRFLGSGKCPNGTLQLVPLCWTHPGSYLSELGLRTPVGDRLVVVAGDAATGFQSISLNAESAESGRHPLDQWGFYRSEVVPPAVIGCRQLSSLRREQ